MKKTMIALVATIMAGACVFLACSKEEENTAKNGTKEKCMMQNEANPYDFMGKLHNEGLEYGFSKLGYGDISEEDIYNSTIEFVEQNFPENSINVHASFDETQTIILNTEETVAALLLGECTTKEFFRDEFLAEMMNRLNELFVNMLETNELTSPEQFAEQTTDLENHIVCLNRHNKPSAYGELNEYDIALISLAIARYSYSYWYSVATDGSHPFHEYFLSGLGNGEKRCPLFKKIGEFFKETGKAIVDAVVVTYTDVSAAFKSIKFFSHGTVGGINVGIRMDLGVSINASSSESHRRKN